MRHIFSVLLWCGLTTAAASDPAATDALNAYRAENGRAPLAYSMMLQNAAEAHAQDMAVRGFFDHRGSDGSDVGERVSRQGYEWCFVAENIAKGQPSLADVMQAWAGSQGHRRNMLSRQAQEFALVEAPGRIWVMVLAAPGC
ncbi:CAP domain-containing protein [uncultured Roseobacter sp.]|uniref:CAP domain-containing protein n=1 Tax=uncultured Roseobacter sp. TaxID=114847 RepID=UPI0026025A78|nr:CAP domain-containing protein [uncultured Roseobacter sp.]